MDVKTLLKQEKIPAHIAIIMDGNGRWAKSRGMSRVLGHQNGVKAVRETTEGCAELGVKYLTLYAFSTENWSRPKTEVFALMELLVRTISKETKTLMKNNIRLRSIGQKLDLPEPTRQKLDQAIAQTAGNTQMHLILALSYSSKWEIMQAVKQIAADSVAGKITPNDINESLFADYLSTHDIPDPELLIRTSGEKRISNFLLWQIAYSELYFTDTLWPDFRREHLYEAILDYQKRERRFGKTSEQLLTI